MKFARSDMHVFVILATFLTIVNAQDTVVDEATRDRINEVFAQNMGNNNSGNNGGNNNNGGTGGIITDGGLEEVVQPNLDSYSASEKCGEGSTKGLKMCVSYHLCDGKTNTIVQQGVTDGFGLIDIRFNANTCAHPLDVCCNLPPGGLDPRLPTPVSNGTEVPIIPEPLPVDRIPDEVIPPVTTPVEVTQAPATPSFCGIRNPNGIDFKITGNKDNEAEYGEFPWMVAILNRNYAVNGLSKPLVCGGSLITPNLVLTGAHCVSRSKNFDLVIRAGEWDTQTTRERLPYQERNVREIRVHPNYNNGNLHNDFAILVLDRAFSKADHIGTICLPNHRQRINSKNCFVSGWGKDQFGQIGQFQSILKKIELPIVDRRACQEALRTTRLTQSFVLDSSFICAGGERGKDACTGDGGSPLVCPDPQNPNRYVQAGIVAWGIGCGKQNLPGVYADVAQFRNWIDQELIRLNIDNSAYTT